MLLLLLICSLDFLSRWRVGSVATRRCYSASQSAGSCLRVAEKSGETHGGANEGEMHLFRKSHMSAGHSGYKIDPDNNQGKGSSVMVIFDVGADLVVSMRHATTCLAA